MSSDVGNTTLPEQYDENIEEIQNRFKSLASQGEDVAKNLENKVEENTVDIMDIEEKKFFTMEDGKKSIVDRYDLEKAIPNEKKHHFEEEDRYWVNEPYAFISIFHSTLDNEVKYYVIEPHINKEENSLLEFLRDKLKNAIKYEQQDIYNIEDEKERRKILRERYFDLLERYELLESNNKSDSVTETLRESLNDPKQIFTSIFTTETDEGETDISYPFEVEKPTTGRQVRPDRVINENGLDELKEYTASKLLYYIERDFIGYRKIDPIKHDINVEDISCDGYETPVFVYHEEHEQIITNITHEREELDNFVVKLAQQSGQGISKRQPQVDATLPDGSRAQLTLGEEVSDHGTNYTIRQFKDVPFTPIDLISWNTFSLEEMAFLWLCIENNKSLIFAGGTASGKTTSLNAVSLFIPSSTKIVSIEDTREVELPQRNWIASVTRPSFSDGSDSIDEFDLLEAALRQRPDYVVMGEIRGEEGRTLFQVMSTGHTTYTTFHADSVDEVLKRFTTEPINVSKTLFTALDLVSIQAQTRVDGKKVRRNQSLTEIKDYQAENDEVEVDNVYQWIAEDDVFERTGSPQVLEEIKFDRGWDDEKLEDELQKRKLILAYLILNGLNKYRQVAATIQAFINDPETTLSLIANDTLEEKLDDLRKMESVVIDVDEEDEESVPRPNPDEETEELCRQIIKESEYILDEYRGKHAQVNDLAESLSPSQNNDSE